MVGCIQLISEEITGGKRDNLGGVVGKLTIISSVRVSVGKENYLS